MRTIAFAAALIFAAPGLRQDEPPIPKELQSPKVAPGAAADFLKTLAKSEDLSGRAEGRHAALILLETLPDTRTYLGSPLAKVLRDDMKRAIQEDLRATAWADRA